MSEFEKILIVLIIIFGIIFEWSSISIAMDINTIKNEILKMNQKHGKKEKTEK